MMFKTHLAFGILTGLLATTFFDLNHEIVFFLLVVFSSILPDIDISNSKIGNKVKPLSWTINFLFGHRGIFHGIFMPLAMYIALFFFNLQEEGIAIFLGYFSHLFLDALSVEGIKLFNPISKFRVSGFIKTGSVFDYSLLILILILTFYLMF